MNTQRIAAIFEKDYKDFMKNTVLLITAALPIFMALLYSQVGDSDGEALVFLIYMIVGITFSAVTSGMILTMMAEENEKKTLRGLIQSPASFIDIIIGKSLVTTIVTFVALAISLMITGLEPLLNVKAIIGVLLLFIFFLLLGIGVGLIAKSVASTYVYLMPIMFLFGFTPMLLNLDFFVNNEIAATIIEYIPIIQAIEAHDTNSWLPLGIISIWVLASAIFVYICFKKTTTDD
ncbi:ABC transporter permease [Alkalicoccobacillus murimartini]|uniref:ABC-2 type transport system permease protein n=1 Tax=Alkalicoccobacillus murimartini TaxID=171685 RepID=A0ABT9YMC2_9BACI|nr:ABC transporter permease [Alkalicoccobacillus murimartini]MDQ0209029.1 ABC-2 type transport system permease protein [Alkalicoccobacillus murimartini]